MDAAERDEKEKEDKEAEEYEESMQPVPRADGYSKMVLSMEPAALETATNAMAHGSERMDAGKGAARPKATDCLGATAGNGGAGPDARG